MKNTKSKIMIIMCVALLIMAVGYAAFSTMLTITGTANIASEWKVVFTDITQVSKTDGVTEKSTPSASGTSATFDVGLTSPGDKIVYKITLANQGTIDAVIKNIEASATDSPAIIFTVDGVNTGDVINNKTSKEFNVTIEYDPHVTSQPDKLQKTLTVSIVTEQYVNQSIDPSTPNVSQPTYLRSEILKNNVAYADTNIDFSQTSEATGTNGLYYTNKNTENNLTTYYFRGAVDNNYVKFGKTGSCTYNGYGMTGDGYFGTPTTEEQCLSSNVCDLSFFAGEPYSYVVGTSDEQCKMLVDNALSETGTGIDTSMITCVYNGLPVVGVDTSTGQFTALSETQCITSNNFCVVGGVAGVLGFDEAACSTYGGELSYGKGTYYPTYPILGLATYNLIDAYWRIVRINEDGSIRLIYNGAGTSDNSGEPSITSSYYSLVTGNASGNANIGYMYGDSSSNTYALTHTNTHNSSIKEVIDEWYEGNLITYSNYLADVGFCNDRSVAPSAGLWASNDTALGYAENVTYYGAYNRLNNLKQPQFACPNESNDLFTTSTSNKGNKALTNPIGLITADEVAYAGGVYGITSTSMYLTTGNDFWTMSPYAVESGSSIRVYSGGHHMGAYDIYLTEFNPSVRPVVNLKSTVEIIDGDGTSGNPYIIKIN